VLTIEEDHGAAAEDLVRVLSGVLEDLLHGPGASGREDDSGSGDGEHSVFANAVGEVLRGVRGELTDRLTLGHPRRDGEALAARREALPDADRDLEVGGRVRGMARRLRELALVDDAVSSGTAVERFTGALAGAGAEVVGVFVLVDMRDVAESVTSVAAALPTQSVSTYLQILDLAVATGVLDSAVHELSVDAILNRWTENDPRWDRLAAAA
jgi:hypothetical protein